MLLVIKADIIVTLRFYIQLKFIVLMLSDKAKTLFVIISIIILASLISEISLVNAQAVPVVLDRTIIDKSELEATGFHTMGLDSPIEEYFVQPFEYENGDLIKGMCLARIKKPEI